MIDFKKMVDFPSDLFILFLGCQARSWRLLCVELHLPVRLLGLRVKSYLSPYCGDKNLLNIYSSNSQAPKRDVKEKSLISILINEEIIITMGLWG